MTMTVQTIARPGRNEPCHCGSKRKYKHCCLSKDDADGISARAQAASRTPLRQRSLLDDANPATKGANGSALEGQDGSWILPPARGPRKVGGS